MGWTERQLTDHFKLSEFVCRCGNCGGLPAMGPTRLLVVEKIHRLAEAIETGLRMPLAVPLTVISGYRCPKHPLTIQTPRSTHARAEAADLKVDPRWDEPGRRIFDGQFLAGFAEAQMYAGRLARGGLGTYVDKPRTLHYDRRGTYARWRHG